LDADTTASIGSGARVAAGGDAVVMASDDTQFTMVSGGVGIGLSAAGLGGSVGVADIAKDTQALVGSNAWVDAKRQGTGVSGVLDGTVNPSGFGTEPVVHGVVVQAESSEAVTHFSVAGGVGLYAGIAGGVSVTLIDSDTRAAIGSGAQINRHSANHLTQARVSAAQDVYVNAANSASVLSFAGALGGGLVGLAGAVDFGSIKNDTTALIGSGALVNARDDVELNAVSIKKLQGFAFSGAGGFVGLAGSVGVWSIGEAFSDSYSTDDGDGNALKGEEDETADAYAGGQAGTGASQVASVLGDSYKTQGGETDKSANSRVVAGLGSASGRLTEKAPDPDSLKNKLEEGLEAEH